MINVYVASHTWMLPCTSGERPEAREGHSATLVGKMLFMFGGLGKSSYDEELYYNDLYILNTGTFLQQTRSMYVNSAQKGERVVEEEEEPCP